MSDKLDITINEFDEIKLHQELIAVGLPMVTPKAGINPSSMKIYFDRDITAEEIATANAVMLAHVPGMSYAESRRAEYQKIQRDEYWEAITEALETPKRTEKLDALLAKKAAIKALYPKP